MKSPGKDTDLVLKNMLEWLDSTKDAHPNASAMGLKIALQLIEKEHFLKGLSIQQTKVKYHGLMENIASLHLNYLSQLNNITIDKLTLEEEKRLLQFLINHLDLEEESMFRFSYVSSRIALEPGCKEGLYQREMQWNMLHAEYNFVEALSKVNDSISTLNSDIWTGIAGFRKGMLTFPGDNMVPLFVEICHNLEECRKEPKHILRRILALTEFADHKGACLLRDCIQSILADPTSYQEKSKS